MKYMVGFINWNGDREILCSNTDGRSEYQTTDINEAYRFRNKHWGDNSRQYVKRVEE